MLYIILFILRLIYGLLIFSGKLVLSVLLPILFVSLTPAKDIWNYPYYNSNKYIRDSKNWHYSTFGDLLLNKKTKGTRGF